MEIPWRYIHDHFNTAGHIAEALCIAAVVTALCFPIFKRRIASIIGIAFAAGHFHGREKRDYELLMHMLPPQLEAYKFWLWDWDQTMDFWPVATLMFALLLLIARKKRLLRQQRKTPSLTDNAS